MLACLTCFRAVGAMLPSVMVPWLAVLSIVWGVAANPCALSVNESFPTFECAPGTPAAAATSARAEWVIRSMRKALKSHGVIIFKGVSSPEEFENLIDVSGIAAETVYKGTSPRNPLPGLKKAMSASEIEPSAHIPHHAEMSFLAGPPQVIAFYCVENNVERGGESMTMDYMALWEHLKSTLSKDTLARFSSDRLQYTRKYSERPSKDISVQKTWIDMFHTDSKAEATRRAEADGYKVDWTNDASPDGDGNVIHLRHSMPPLRRHPDLEQMVFHNHIGVLHHTSFSGELERSAHRYNDTDMLATALQLKSTTNGTDVTWASDGAPIDDVAQAVRDWAWSNSVFLNYKKGDLVLLDNFRFSHARTPYKGGPRIVATLWGNWSIPEPESHVTRAEL